MQIISLNILLHHTINKFVLLTSLKDIQLLQKIHLPVYEGVLRPIRDSLHTQILEDSQTH